MKSVLISIQPKWCDRIADGKKTIEVRKTAPKCDVPFKCYIYATKKEYLQYIFRKGEYIFSDDHSMGKFDENIFVKNRHDWQGKVIGEFVCDEVDTYCCCDLGYEISEETFNKIMLTGYEFYDYGKRKTLRGWHISDLKIYDNPKELSEFVLPCRVSCENCKNPLYYARKCEEKGVKCITCPPQSWCYVEER